MRIVRTIGAAVSAVVLLGAVELPADAATSEPPPAVVVPVPSVELPEQIDNPAFYEAQVICDPTPRPGAVALGKLLVATYGPATVYIPRSCTSNVSEHFDGRAVDWMRTVRDPAQKAMADAFVAWLLAPAADGTPHEMARRMGIMYIIWNNRMIRMYDVSRGWTNYRNCLDPANAGVSLDTSCHRDHVHISMTWDGAAKLTSWWSGVARTLPSCSARTTSASPRAGTPAVVTDPAAAPGLVPVTARTILDTSAGLGAGLGGACRALAGRALYPKAVVTGAPPGATWVALSVSSQANAPSQLVVWSSGGARPKRLVSTPMGSTRSTVLVPLASDGTVGLSTTVGSARLKAQVVGYLTGPPQTEPGPTPSPSPTPAPQPTPPPAKPPTVTPKAPSAPRNVRATSYRGVVTTRWSAPASSGTSAIRGYRVQALVSAKRGAKVAGTCTTTAKGRACSIKGLKRGRTYWMSVSVRNAVGTTWALRKPVVVR